jgi:hypothetical protein
MSPASRSCGGRLGVLGEKGVDCGGDLFGTLKYHEVPGVGDDDFAVGLKRGAELGAVVGLQNLVVLASDNTHRHALGLAFQPGEALNVLGQAEQHPRLIGGHGWRRAGGPAARARRGLVR